MIDAVPLADRIKTDINLGESHFREFKSAWEGPPDNKTSRDKKAIGSEVCSTLVGFANADGGTLLIGVEDDGQITGLSRTDQQYIDYLRNCWKDGVHKDTPLRNVQINLLKIDDKDILQFSILKSTEFIHQTSDGKCLQRRDLETLPISVAEITFSRAEQRSQEYDREFVDGATVHDLNREAVQTLADNISRGMTVERCLQHTRLAEVAAGELRLRKAALLLFASDSLRWHPRLQIRILKVSGTEVKAGTNYNVVADEYVYGNILELIEKAWDKLRPHLVQTRFSGAARFETKVLYPEFACQEALINAIAHRDYSQEGRGIEIYVFEDRMEVKSPGELLSTLRLEDVKSLTGAHQSRNTFVARYLRELGYMQEVGEGMRRIFELMHANELQEPKLVNDNGSFSVVLSNKTQYSQEHILWLENFQEFSLSREEKAIVVLGYDGRRIAPSEIWDSLGIVDTERYRQIIDGLQRKSIIHSDITREAAQSIARRSRINTRDVPRFFIAKPTEEELNIKNIRRQKRNASQKDDNFSSISRVYLSNIPEDIDRDEILEKFRDAGYNVDIVWPRKRHKHSRQNYAFLQFDSRDEAESAIEKLDGLELGDRTLVARWANPMKSSAI